MPPAITKFDSGFFELQLANVRILAKDRLSLIHAYVLWEELRTQERKSKEHSLHYVSANSGSTDQ